MTTMNTEYDLPEDTCDDGALAAGDAHDYEMFCQREQVRKADEALGVWVKSIFDLSPAIEVVTVGGSMSEEGSWTPYLKVRTESGMVLPDELDEDTDPPELLMLAATLAEIEVSEVVAPFACALPGDDEEDFYRVQR